MSFRKCCRITPEFCKIKAKALAEDVILQLVNNGRGISLISEILLVEKKREGVFIKTNYVLFSYTYCLTFYIF